MDKIIGQAMMGAAVANALFYFGMWGPEAVVLGVLFVMGFRILMDGYR